MSEFIEVQAIRTNSCTGVASDVTVKVGRKYHAGHLNSWWIEIVEGGVTGYESMMEDHVGEMTGGWSVCAGTKYSWDSLFISSEEMQKIAKWIEQEKSMNVGAGAHSSTSLRRD